MARVTFQLSDGRDMEVETTRGSLMQAAVAHGVPGIPGDCGGNAACATCHVHVDEAWAETVGPAGEAELAMLEFEDDLAPHSRLACQIEITEALDGLRVRVAADPA